MALLFFATTQPAFAEVTITVNRATQRMTVVVDGEQRYVWPVGTGLRHDWTRPGTFGVQSMARHHRSRKYNNAPMPHSIFYDGDRAIHGSYATVGRPASHGCVRLHPGNAAILFVLVGAQRGLTRIRIL